MKKQPHACQGKANWENRTLFHYDNLDVMRGMNSESVDLIATDPPFNKGKDFHATPDSLARGATFQDRWRWEKDAREEWVDEITDDFPHVMQLIQGSRLSYGDDMGAFLCFMAVRLLEMRRVMKGTASIYLHCDPTASHYLKLLMDTIFGSEHFQNEFIWHYGGGGASRQRWGRKHDVILFYSRGDCWTFNTDAVRTPYKWTDGQARADGSQRLAKGKLPDDVWQRHSVMPWSKERFGYPTQKPLALYERIIKASSNKGDVVLDPFCGCATTLVAAERLEREWVGIDIWDKAWKAVLRRLEDENFIVKGGSSPRLAFGDVHYRKQLPVRGDDGQCPVPFPRVKETVQEPAGKKMSHADMYQILLKQHGLKCQGCDRVFDDPRYLELDHNTPRSDGGIKHLSNRILLCSPCKRAKSKQYTLSTLRQLNRKKNQMAK